LRLIAAHIGDTLQLTATGATNTNWRLEFRDTVIGTNDWQPFANIMLGADPFVLQEPFTATNRFYRGKLLP
jgi:hypothetical protein